LGAIETLPLERQPLGDPSRRAFKKGELLWAAGSDPGHVWTIERGHVAIGITDADGDNSIVQVCTHGQSLCPAAALLGRPFPCNAVASEDLVATAVPRSSVLKSWGGLAPWVRGMFHQMASDLCGSHLAHSQAPTTARHRIARLLERLDIQFQGAALPFRRQDLAEMSGTTVETAIRTLGPWEKKGIIHSETHSVQVVRSSELQGIRD
jgi:CRP/FNR family transcriptional regulator